MMPPPPPEYSSGMPSSVSGGYPPSGPDLKASPLHTGPSLGPDLMGPSGGPPPLIPSEYPPCTGPGSNGNGPGTSGFGNTPFSDLMMPPPSLEASEDQRCFEECGRVVSVQVICPPTWTDLESGGALRGMVVGCLLWFLLLPPYAKLF
ncbi:hypothetical protein CSKR_202662 [Clonorchis sinensis]|uniref:Uncharacterized protein n=1 Tax=Clonorchis sinensis TaxID=79923 RepID=A0A8T1M139_CLOSI|nr:hypothetical protein CSKR_202662 [Clonorchis sinensis]